MAKRLNQVYPSTSQQMLPLVVFKINCSKRFFLHLTLHVACQTVLYELGYFVMLIYYVFFFFVGTEKTIPSGKDRSILPARVFNQNRGFASSCLLVEQAI